MLKKLKATERRELTRCETVIQQKKKDYVQVGNALLAIHTGRLYREKFDTFDDYCVRRWGFKRAHGYRQIEAARIAGLIHAAYPNGDVPIPKNEATARALTKLVAEAVPSVWKNMFDSGDLTAKATARMVHAVIAANPKLAKKETFALLHQQSEAKRQQRLAKLKELEGKSPEFPDGRFSLIYADPPWRPEYERSEARRIDNHYPTMDLADICALPVADLATPDAIIFLWVTNNMVPAGLDVMKAWGFEYKTNMAWDKVRFALGCYVRGQHEILLIGVRGHVPRPAEANRPPSVIREKRTTHSTKPEAAYQVIEQMYPELAKVELFARGKPRKGWTAWGNEVIPDKAA